MDEETLHRALGPVEVPERVWAGIKARLERECLGALVAPAAWPGLAEPRPDPVPVLAAAASFCVLLQVYLVAGPLASLGPLLAFVSRAVLLLERWAASAAAATLGG